MKNAENAKLFIEAIKNLSKKNYVLENFESYLSLHFYSWLEKNSTDPNSFVEELLCWANSEE